MRIISQDKEFDLPYEETTIKAFNDGEVAAFALNDLGGSDYILMAKYSTKEKAMEAMKMCREKYGQCKANEILLTGTGSCFDCHPIDFENVAKTNVFQFPQDEEVKSMKNKLLSKENGEKSEDKK